MGILDDFSNRTASDWTRRVKELVDAAEDQGWKINKTKKNQYQFIPPDLNQEMVVLAGTASDVRALDNMISRLKRSGFLWPWDNMAKEQFNQQETVVEPEEKKPEFKHRDYAAEQQYESDDRQARDEIKYINQLINEGEKPEEINKLLAQKQAAYNKDDRQK